MRLLVIGGTHLVGRAAVEEAVARGHGVTVFHRGPDEPAGFPDVEHVHGDRDGGLQALGGRTWDVALDTCGYVPRQVREAAEVLGDAVAHYGFVSSISVYPDDTPAHAAEETPVYAPPFAQTEEITEGSYGPLKVACEEEARAGFAGRCLIVRPGYVVGRHDRTDRFTSWVLRAARGGTMLAPEPRDQPLQVVDARDLAAFTLDRLEARDDDVYCVVGPDTALRWGEAIPVLVENGGAGAQPVWVGADFLRERLGEDVGTALPLWDLDEAGLHQVDATKARAAGLRCRPFAEIARDVLEGCRDRFGAPLRVGLTPELEAELLAAWHAGTS
jgi:nucleoside-diphosphate-sugar epimerase